MKTFKKQGFTLVELIIVIAIIAVLAVAAFMMLTKWLGKSRDSRRISDLATIQKGLEVGYSDFDNGNGFYPDISKQDGVVKLLSGTTVIGYQGIVDIKVANGANLQKVPLDPSDNNEYTYMTTENRKKFQIMAMLEDETQVTMVANNTYALDYSNRNTYVLGYELGVVKEISSNLPVQFVIGLTGIDLTTDDTYEGVINNNGNEVGSKIVLYSLQTEGGLVKKWIELDTNCKTKDVVVGNQVWAGCNSTLGQGEERGKLLDGTDRTIENCFNYDSAIDLTKCLPGNINIASNSSERLYFDSVQPSGTNLNGDSSVDNIWGKYYKWEFANTACLSGRHLPTNEEYEELEIFLGCSDSDVIGTWKCTDLGWKGHNGKNASNNMVEALKFPLPGHVTMSENARYLGLNTYIWTSTNSGGFASTVYMHFNQPGMAIYNFDKTNLFSVRCIKD